MELGIIGLGRMGLGLALRAAQRGHEVVAWDVSDHARRRAHDQGLGAPATVDDLVEALRPPRAIFLYVPHGDPVDLTLQRLVPLLDPGDVVVDGGNSHWHDSARRHQELERSQIRFLDVGTSGGTSDALGWQGAAFMVGGDPDAFEFVAPVLRDLAVDDGAVHHVGPASTGHFAKLVHNAIEFGMLQAIGEGVELLARSPHADDIDLAALFEHWSHGTVIRGWLIELMANALRAQPGLEQLSTHVEDTGEVKWIVDWASDRDIPIPVTALAQQMLMVYRDHGSPAAKAVALLRNQFGGHPLHGTDDVDVTPGAGS
ncbi:MAG: NADP-dependent phosphogluconate dehydrogenase [Nitriliruptoraceae bacterium]